MKINFDEIYNEIDKNELEDSWKEIGASKRKALLIAFIILVIVGVFSECVLFINNLENEISFIDLIILPIMLGVIALFTLPITYALAGSKSRAQYGGIYKRTIINKMISNFFSNVQYNPYEGLNESIYDEGLYNEYYNIYDSEDHVEAVIDNKNALRFAEVHTILDDEYINSSEGSGAARVTKFYGMFAQIDINSNINAPIRIRPNKLFRRKNDVELDSTEFEKIFDVESEDRIKAIQYLTHEVMEELVRFYEILGKNFDIYITKEHIYIRLHIGAIFDTAVSKKEVINKKKAEEYFKILQFFYNFSKRMIAISEDNKF